MEDEGWELWSVFKTEEKFWWSPKTKARAPFSSFAPRLQRAFGPRAVPFALLWGLLTAEY